MNFNDFDREFKKDQKRFNFMFNTIFGFIMLVFVAIFAFAVYLFFKGPEILDKLLDIAKTFAGN